MSNFGVYTVTKGKDSGEKYGEDIGRTTKFTKKA
jgi:hypothetical protein